MHERFLERDEAARCGVYGAFRSGFAHGYPSLKYKWGRNGLGKYWYEVDGKSTLNIDQFVAGFIDGLAEFKRKVVGTDLEDDFVKLITLEAPPKLRGKARRK